MGTIYDLVQHFGREEARRLHPAQSSLIDMAARLAAEQEHEGDLQFSYSGFCLTALPHKEFKEQYWEKGGGVVKLIVEGGMLPIQGKKQQFGIPYGSRARLILLYLQTRALQTNSPEVEIGSSMKAWLDRMNVPVGGNSYRAIKEQALRLSACRMTFSWSVDGADQFEKTSIISKGILFSDNKINDKQQTLWRDTVRLSSEFFDQLKLHPVPIWEPAIRELSNNSIALDIYTWLAYRLRSLKKPTPISWKQLQAQFGPNYTHIPSFRRDFRTAMAYAMTAYPEAKASDEGLSGIILYPSPPPVPERLSICAGSGSTIRFPKATK